MTVGYHYGRSRERLTEVLRPIGDMEWDRSVAACPGWRVRDVLAHLYGNTEDALAGRITGPPTTDQTAEQVARHLADDPAELVRAWNEIAPVFEEVATQMEVWPAAIDMVSHEHDLRGALDRPGARDDESVVFFARRLVQGIDAPVPLRVVVDGEPVGATEDPGDDVLTLETSAFEVLRFRLGRRTRAQVAALSWSGDPTPVLDHLFVFGPAAEPIIE